MEYSLRLISLFIFFSSGFRFELLSAQQDSLSLTESDFAREVMTDFGRLEGYKVVYNGYYNGSVRKIITDPLAFTYLLYKTGKIKDSTHTKSVEPFLTSGDAFIGTKLYLEAGEYEIAPTNSRVYKYRNKSTEKLIRKFFNKELRLKRNYKNDDRLALIVVLFERRIPYHISGYGSKIRRGDQLNIRLLQKER